MNHVIVCDCIELCWSCLNILASILLTLELDSDPELRLDSVPDLRLNNHPDLRLDSEPDLRLA